MNELHNFTYLFSYWIFLWFIVYYSGYFKEYNPKLALMAGMAVEIFLIVLMFFNGVSIGYIFIFFLIQFLTKVIPLYFIRNTPINLIPDLKLTVFVFLFYLAWLYWNGINVIDINKKAFYNFTNGTADAPLMNLFKKYGII